MDDSFRKLLEGYQQFRKKYVLGDQSIMHSLSYHGQQPKIMVVACCDSRVDPALILQCDPGDLFVVRNVANIVPPYEKDENHHGTSAALEFGICFLKIRHLVLLGHSQCGGIRALLNGAEAENDFVSNWVSLLKGTQHYQDADEFTKFALHQSYLNCLSFPWIHQAVSQQKLAIHQWFFDIKAGEIFSYSEESKTYQSLEAIENSE